jgi:hypothetical protein
MSETCRHFCNCYTSALDFAGVATFLVDGDGVDASGLSEVSYWLVCRGSGCD